MESSCFPTQHIVQLTNHAHRCKHIRPINACRLQETLTPLTKSSILRSFTSQVSNTDTMATTTIEENATTATTSPDLSKYDFAELEPYVHPPETKEDLPWSELVTLDLEDYGRPGGKERLAKQLEHAVHHVGFVSQSSVSSHGVLVLIGGSSM
jgi:hypothetical protein